MNEDFIANYLGPEYLPGRGGQVPKFEEVLQAVKARKVKRSWLEAVLANALTQALEIELAKGGSDGG